MPWLDPSPTTVADSFVLTPVEEITAKRRNCGPRGVRFFAVSGGRGVGCLLTGGRGLVMLDMEEDEDDEDDEDEDDEDS